MQAAPTRPACLPRAWCRGLPTSPRGLPPPTRVIGDLDHTPDAALPPHLPLARTHPPPLPAAHPQATTDRPGLHGPAPHCTLWRCVSSQQGNGGASHAQQPAAAAAGRHCGGGSGGRGARPVHPLASRSGRCANLPPRLPVRGWAQGLQGACRRLGGLAGQPIARGAVPAAAPATWHGGAAVVHPTLTPAKASTPPTLLPVLVHSHTPSPCCSLSAAGRCLALWARCSWCWRRCSRP